MRLECRALSKVYQVGRRSVHALADVSFSVDSGTFVSIVGPSGCGKTTLLKLVAGLLAPTGGEVVLGDCSQPAPTEARSAMVFQDHGLFPWMRVLDNVAFGLEARGVGTTARREAARQWLQKMGMGAFAHAYPHELSGGMRQRVALGRAFLTEAPLLLMDEPLGALDAQMRVLLQAELLDQWALQRHTVLYVTHDISEALLLGDRVLVMSSRPGRILASHVTPLGRPRAAKDLDRPELVELRWRIWESIEVEVRRSMGVA